MLSPVRAPVPFLAVPPNWWKSAGAVSHFQKAVLKVGNFLIFLALALSLILILAELARGQDALNLIQFVLILVVASIPVAMPAVLSVTMALGALTLSQAQGHCLQAAGH